MSAIDIAGITLLGFILTIIVVARVKQEIKKYSEKIERELAEIKEILKEQKKS